MYKRIFLLLFPLLLIAFFLAIATTGRFKYPTFQDVDRAALHPAYPLSEDVDVATVSPGQYGGVFVITGSQPPKTLNPLVTEDAYSSQAIQLLFSALTEYNVIDQSIHPGLAKSWVISDDFKTYTFHLRRGIRWSDGEPFSADDVIFTFDCIFDPRYPNRNEQQLTIDGQILQYRKIDKYTVALTTANLYAPLLYDLLSIEILPKHKLYSAFQDGSLQKQWNLETAIKDPQSIVGMGPFRIREFRSGERTIYEPNPYYWRADVIGQRLPYIDFYILKYVPDSNTEMVLFATGESDAMNINSQDLAWVKRSAKIHGFNIYPRGPSPGINFIWFNMKPGKNDKGDFYVKPYKLKWFTDKRFRQAISYAINRKGIINAISLGDGSPLNSIISPANKKWHNPDTPKYPFNRQKTRALLREAGFHYDSKGDLIDAPGNPVVFQLLVSESSERSATLYTSFQEDMKAIGIKVDLTYLDFATVVDKIDNTFDYEAASIAFSGSDDPSGGKTVYRSDGRLHIWNPEQEEPATPWEARIDEIMDLQEREMDEKKRIALIYELQNIFAEELPLIFLVSSNFYSGIKSHWHNIKIPQGGGSLLWNIEELWIDKLENL